MLALAVGHHGREDHQLGGVFQRQHRVDHLRHRLCGQRMLRVIRAVWRTDARVQQAQVVMDFGHGADRRTGIVRRRFLLDRNGRRQPFDQVDVGLFHQLQELARVGRQRLDVAALAFGVQRVEGERRFARAGQAGDDGQLVARQVEVDVFEVVRTGATDANVFHESGWLSNKVQGRRASLQALSGPKIGAACYYSRFFSASSFMTKSKRHHFSQAGRAGMSGVRSCRIHACSGRIAGVARTNAPEIQNIIGRMTVANAVKCSDNGGCPNAHR